MPTQTTTSPPPSSSANYVVNFFSLLLFFAAMALLKTLFTKMTTTTLMGICLLSTSIPLWLYDSLILKVHTRSSTGLGISARKVDQKRLSIKLIGLFATFFVIALLYRLIPFYAHPFYAPFFQILRVTTPFIVVLCCIYFRFVDPRQVDPFDGYWHMGCLITGRWKNVNVIILREHSLVWFIKAFFTPIMLGILAANIQEAFSLSWQTPGQKFLSTYNLSLIVFYTIDVIYGLLGYVITLRILDNHIRSVEPTLIGWLTCLACYAPFSKLALERLPYEDQILWHQWFFNCPIIIYFWGIVIILLSLVYCLATVAFGYRMSNLTYRGIITAGPYRYTKHPAYLCKVLSWWMISLPFLTVEDPMVAIKNTLALGVISLIYYIRARTEENHLSNYPEYVEYAEWIKRNGVLKSVTKYFPFWQYSFEKSKRWNSIVWFKRIEKKN